MQWRDLLLAKVAATSKKVVAEELRLSRTTVSLVVDGKYPAATTTIEKRVLEVYARFICPHLEQEISQATCRSHHESNAPISSPRAMKHWRACQTCPYNTKGKDDASS